MTSRAIGPFNIDRVFAAIGKQRERRVRAALALDCASIPYAVAGDFAVACWVCQIDASATRAPAQIDVVLRREDLPNATAALERNGFQYYSAENVHAFVELSNRPLREAVCVLFASEQFGESQLIATPDVLESEPTADSRVMTRNALVRLLLSTFRTVETMHLRDMLDVGLIDATWTGRLPTELATRLQSLIDNPDG